jgi:hypothetical protein
VAAVALIVASTLKAFDLRLQLQLGTIVADQLFGPIFLIIGEWTLGFWLISSVFPTISRICALVVFSALLIYSSFLTVSGASSCNCFGHIRVQPIWVALFDLIVVGLLVANPIGAATKQIRNCRCLVYYGAIPACVTALGVFWAIVAFGPEGLPTDSRAEPGSAIFLRPADWIDKQFPLTPYIKDGVRLLHGDWIVTFHKDNCSACEDAVTKIYTTAYGDQARGPEKTHFAVITFPESKNSPAQPTDRIDGLVERMSVSSGYQWHAPSPNFLRLSNGKVVSTSFDFGSLVPDLPPQRVDSHRQITWSGGMPDYRAIRAIQRQNSFACGPYALLAILESMNRRPSESAINTMIAAAGEKGTDFAMLQELAEAQGLRAMGVTATIGQLRQLAIPAIVHIDKCGFVAAIGYVPDGVRIADPSGHVHVFPDDVFATRFGKAGRALLVSDQELPVFANANSASGPEESNGLQTEKSMATLGVLHKLSWQTTIPVVNKSRQTIKITESKAIRDRRNGCNNEVKVTVDKSTLRGGESATIRVSGKEQGCGGFTHFIVLTAEPKGASIVVPLHGYVEQSVGVGRPIFEARQVLSGDTATLDIPVELPPNANGELVHVDVRQGPPLTWKPIISSTGPAIRVEGKDLPVGNHRTLLAIRASANHDWVPTEVTVLTPVVDKIVLTPPSVTFENTSDGKDQTRQLKITRQDGGPIDGTVEVLSPSEHKGLIAAWLNPGKGVVDLRLVQLASMPSLKSNIVIPARIVFADGQGHDFSILIKHHNGTLQSNAPTLRTDTKE